MNSYGSLARKLQILIGAVLALAVFNPSDVHAQGQGKPKTLPNSPGLQCRGARDGGSANILVYAKPALDAPTLGVVHSYVIATGPARDGFVPVTTGSGVTGWTRAEETIPDRFMKMPCWIIRQPNGHFLMKFTASADNFPH